MDIKPLLKRLEAQGLDIAEDMAAILLSEVMDFLVEEAIKSENKIDDLLVAIMPVIKPMLMDMIDKIDKKEG